MPMEIDHIMAQLSKAIRSQTGLYFPQERWKEMEHSISKAGRELGFEETEKFIHQFLSLGLGKEALKTLIHHLTIGETYFFRDKGVFDALQYQVLPSLIELRKARRKSLRFCSLACCTGEEPYSLAIVIDQVLSDREDWHITILGGDINDRFLKKAKEGVYTKWSLRQTPEWIVRRYFTQKGDNSFILCPHIRQMVDFQHLNLASDKDLVSFFKQRQMDVIFCRNVFMYLAPDVRKEIVRRIIWALSLNGWLILSPGEAPILDHAGLTSFSFQNAILYKKDASPPANHTHCGAVSADHRTAKTESTLYRKTGSGPSKDLDPGGKEALCTVFNDAHSLYQTGRVNEAEARLKKLLALSSDVPETFNLQAEAKALLARIYADRSRLDEAAKWAMDAVVTNKTDPVHHYLMGVIFEEQGRLEEATKFLRQAIYLDPDFVLAHFALGNLATIQGRQSEAERHFRNVSDILSSLPPDSILPHSEGMVVGTLKTAIKSMMEGENQTYGL